MADVRRKNFQTLQEDLYALSAEVSDLAASSPDNPSQALEEVRKRISRVRADFRKVASEISGNRPTTVVAVADKIVDPVEDTLGERPIATIALGLGAGFVLGKIWKRR
jgi:ElaB/YqjD/DUF883 family membrane-anchored ribosome-binding protein